MKKSICFVVFLSLLFSLSSYASSIKTLRVTASAYNSVRAQTNHQPNLTAWGVRLKPGMKAVAISRDLLQKGFKKGTRIKIQGLTGEYIVLDKMHRRWRNKIDIYMGNDVKAARKWGKRTVTIQILN